MLAFTQLTIDTGPGDLFWPWVIRGASMAFLFVPLTVATLRSLQGQQLADGTGFFNLARQLGGSAGIAALSTYLAHKTHLHWSELTESITPYHNTTQWRLVQMQHFFMHKGAGPYIAHQRALAALSGRISVQAFVLAFNDAFFVIAIIFAAMIPLIFLLRRNKLGGGSSLQAE
jgi:DHA2 family multidrug resistance protein